MTISLNRGLSESVLASIIMSNMVPAGKTERALKEQMHASLLRTNAVDGTAVIIQNFVLSS